MFLDHDVFRTVVASTPLVSIDLVIQNAAGDILLGLRRNRPAKGSWFVPGGRIQKGESLDAAFGRIARDELGFEVPRSKSLLLGVYEHHYADSAVGEDVSTHYIVLAHRLQLEQSLDLDGMDQHSALRWWSLAEAAASSEVHHYSKLYVQALLENPGKDELR